MRYISRSYGFGGLHTHFWISVLGKMLNMASEKPDKLSVHAINISLTPRLLRSVKTDSQNLAPSLSETYIPISSFLPSLLIAKTLYIALLATFPSSLTL